MADETKAQTEKFAAEAQKNMDAMTKNMEGMASFGQQNLDAMVESSRAAAKAFESLNAEMMAFSKRSMQEGMAAMKDISSAKSMGELFEKQTNYTKTALESLVDEMGKMNDMLATAMKDASQPLNDRVNASMDYAKSMTA